MRLGAAIDLYLETCALDRGLVPLTLERYRRDLDRFRHAMPAQHLQQLVPADLHAFAALLGRTLAIRSHVRVAVVVKGFLRWAGRPDLAEHLVLPDRPRPLPQFLSLAHVLALLAAPDPATPRGCRDLAMIELLYAAGLRVSELVKLRATDLQRTYLRTVGKGGRERLVPVGKPARKAIDRYLRESRPHLARGHAPTAALFLTVRGCPMSPRWFEVLIKRYARAAGIPDRVYPHLVRHTFATHLLWRGAELRAIQAMLGHASINSTEVYTHLARPHLRRFYRRHHPRAR